MRVFKITKSGVKFDKIVNDDGVEFVFSPLGAAIVSIKDGDTYLTRNVSKAFDFKNANCYYGKTIGRVANRMRGNSITINGKECKLENNEGDNVLHGGLDALSTKEFSSSGLLKGNIYVLTYQYLSKSGESGYPGDFLCRITYSIYAKGIELDVKMQVGVNEDTLCSLTNHTYFTLGSPDISSLSLKINSDAYVDVDKDMIATSIKPVNEVMDFRKYKLISKDIDDPSINHDRLKGYDHFYYFKKKGINIPNVSLRNNVYQLDIFTDFEGAQIYTSNFKLDFELLPACEEIRDSVAIEPSDSHMYLRILKKGQAYCRNIKYKITKASKKKMAVPSVKDTVKKEFKEQYGLEADKVFSCGGRFEILGNHTDHNHGLCLAATCDLCITAAVKKSDDINVFFTSKGYPDTDIVNITYLKPIEEEKGKSRALIRGIAEYLKTNGYNVGGFIAYSESSIFPGAGVSSSAAFELLVAQIFNDLYNEGKIPALDLCKAGQYAENVYFGKASGLLDQIGVGYGNIVYIDFEEIKNPKIDHIPFPFDNLHFVIINTGGSHAHLSHLYSQIPQDMYSAAKKSGVEFLRETSFDKLDKAALSDIEYSRSLHFYSENERVQNAVEAIKNKDQEAFLRMINESRESSTKNLKNMMVEDQYEGSPLEACDYFMEVTGGKGAIKINGGGFAGSVISVVPDELLKEVIQKMGEKYGPENVKEVRVRPNGPIVEK